MSQLKTNTQIPNVQQIAGKINENFNGFPTLAMALIDLIRDDDLPDATVAHLYRGIRKIKLSRAPSIKRFDNSSSWLPYC